MPDTPLVLPYTVEGVIIDVLGRRHPEHLAKLERQLGKQPQTFEPFATMVRMADASGLKLSGDTVPALLLAVIGAPEFRRNENDRIDARYQLGMQVTAMGNRRRDTLYRRDVYAWTVVECMYQRLPRGSGGMINGIRLVDYEPIAEADTQRTLADARLVFEVDVIDVLAIRGGYPADDSTWPASGGGAPPSPYTPPEPFPAADVTFEIDRTPIVE